MRKTFLAGILLYFFSFMGQAQTPTPDYLIAGIYNQNDPRISITGSYESSLDGTYYLGDAASFGVPGYGSDLATGGTASASTATFGAASNAFDNDNVTFWGSNTVAYPHWIEYQLPSPYEINRYTMRAASNFVTRTPGTFVLQYWDGTSWVISDSRSGITWSANEQKTFDVSVPVQATRWRIYVTNNSGDDTNTRIAEIELFEATGTETFSIDFDFYGDSFLLHTEKNPNPRSIQICVDSTCNGVGLYSSISEAASIAVSGLTTGLHSVSIQSISGGGSNSFIFDAIEIQPDFGSSDINVNVQVTLAPPATESYRQFVEVISAEGTPQAGQFEYTATVGDVVSGALLFILVLISLVALLLYFFQMRGERK